MLNIDTTYPGQTAGTNANYPNGQARNVTVSGDGTGTPWEQQLLNDILGFMNAAVDEAGITVSGSPDTALASDVLDGLKALLGLPKNHLEGLRITRDSTVLMTTLPGSARNFANTRNLVLPAATQKDISGTWVAGDGNGGLPDPLTIAADTWYRRFIAGKADGSGTDLCWDTSATAANFFLDANAIAAGYTDATLYRRYGWTFSGTGSTIDNHFSPEDDPRRYVWDVPREATFPLEPGTGSRQGLIAVGELAPPDSLGSFTFRMDTQALVRVLVTSLAQTDSAVTSAVFTLMSAESSTSRVAANLDVMADLNGNIYARADVLDGGTLFRTIGRGWLDEGIIP